VPQLINRVPPGLLSLLGIQSTGRNPVLLADDLQPVLNLTDAYLFAQSVPFADTTAAIGATGFVSGLSSPTPPPGEIWVFSSYTVVFTVPLPAGTTYRVRPCVGETSSGIIVHCGEVASGTVGERPIARSGEPFYVAPGQLVGAYCESVTLGTAQAVALYGRRTILRV
jgi:hypothetical protein